MRLLYQLSYIGKNEEHIRSTPLVCPNATNPNHVRVGGFLVLHMVVQTRFDFKCFFGMIRRLCRYRSANVAQLVERIHGKDEVPSSILGIGSQSKSSREGVFTCRHRQKAQCCMVLRTLLWWCKLWFGCASCRRKTCL